MNSKKIFKILLCFAVFQIAAPTIQASEIAPQTVEQQNVHYARVNPTPAQVRAAEPTDLVTFTDPVLEASIAKQLKVQVGAITVNDMSTLTQINCYDNISNIEGLEYAVNLTRLSLFNNSLSDLTPISGSTKLDYIAIQNTNVSDASPISNISTLTSVGIGMSKIEDTTPFGKLTNLKNLSLHSNNITDISPLSSLTNLTSLYISDNKITDVEPLAQLTKLSSLMISNNNISDISSLKNLTNISSLTMEFNKIEDISVLANFTKLIDLTANDNLITDISPLDNFTAMKVLIISNNKIEDVSPISDFFDLYGLRLDGNRITDMSPLTELFDRGGLEGGDIYNQAIDLPEITVANDDEIIFEITGHEGVKIPVSLGKPVPGVNSLTGTANYLFSQYYPYDITINQTVKYSKIDGLTTAISNENKTLNNEQLITLFNVTSITNNPITADDSAVDYNTPGTYDVVFSDEIVTYTAQLTINDVQPTIALAKNSITIKLGDHINDYVDAFGAIATESTAGDLTTSITVDDSNVDFNQIGNYTINFTVADNDGNTKTIAGELVIADSEIENSENTIPEIPGDETIDESPVDIPTPELPTDDNSSEVISADDSSEVISDDDSSEVISDDKNSVINPDITNTVTSTKSTKAMTKTQMLASTGYTTGLVVIVLTFISAMLFTVKKNIVKNER